MWINPFVIWLLYSPLHGLLSKNILVLTYRGCRSGKLYRVPVNYTRQGDKLVTFSYRERLWWRNLRGGAPVILRLEGKDVHAMGSVIEDAAAVAEALAAYLRQKPQISKYFQVGLNTDGQPEEKDIQRVAVERVAIFWDLR